MSERLDLVVIGSGPAGEKGAAQAAYFGKRVAVVERAESPGGVTVRNATIPTKTLRETALYVTGFRKRDVYGLRLQLHPQLMLDRLRDRTAEVVAAMTEQVRDNLDHHGIELIRGEASLGPGPTVVVDRREGGRRIFDAEAILIATGSRPFRPPGIPFDDPDVFDSEAILALERIPRSLLVVGGGAVGCEYASIFAALGTAVTLLEGGDRLIPFLDAEVSELLADEFTKEGIAIVRDRVEGIERSTSGLLVHLRSGQALRPDQVLFAVGRVGNTEPLGLEDAGVSVDDRGRILVDSTYRTTARGIYAAGDVIGAPALASVSMEQGRVAICHAFGFPFKDVVDPIPPYGVYTIPEAAMVGLTEEQARAEGIDYEVGRGRFERNPRAKISGATEGLIKLVFAREDRRLLGVHILGESAGELIHLGQSVLHQGGTMDRFIHATFNLPTLAEAYKYAAYDGLQRLSGRSSGRSATTLDPGRRGP